MQPALMREGIPADECLPTGGRDIRQLVDQHRDFAELFQLRGRNALIAELELKVGDDRDEVGVTAALADPIDGALHLGGADAHRSDGIGDCDLGIIVAMDRDSAFDRAERGAHRLFDISRQPAAVGIAQADGIGAGLADGADAVHRVFAIVVVAVEKMLRIEDDFIDVLLQKRNRVAQDVEVLFEGNPQRLAHVEVPGLANDGGDGSVGLQ